MKRKILLKEEEGIFSRENLLLFKIIFDNFNK